MNHFQVTFKHPVLGEFSYPIETDKDRHFIRGNITELIEGKEPHMSLGWCIDREVIITPEVARQGVWQVREWFQGENQGSNASRQTANQCRKMLSDGKISPVIEALKSRGITLDVFDVFDELENSEDAVDDKDAHIRRLQKRHGLIIGLLKGLDELEESL